MSYTLPNLVDFLSSIDHFKELPPQQISYLAERMQIGRYGIGQELMRKDRTYSNLLLVYQGQVRLLGLDPTTKIPLTLGLAKTGVLIGLVNYLTGKSSEIAIASSEDLVCLSLAKRDFETLVENYPRFKESIEKYLSPVEIYEVLIKYYQKQARINPNLKQLVKSLVLDVEISATPLEEDNERIWLESQNQRWLGIPKKALSLEEEQEIPTVNVEIVGFDVDLPNIPHLVNPVAEEELLPPSTNDQQDQQNYPFVAGRTAEEEGMACFAMLCRHFNMPFKRDILKRIIQETLQRQGSLSLSFYGAVSQLLGLDAQLIKIPANQIVNLETPFLIQWQDSLALVYEISSRRIVVAVPQVGLIKRNLKDFLETWNSEGEEGEVALLQRSKSTPKDRFGLSWFWPAIKKHRRVLIEVFIASFFVQLFGLANPLMLQVIIDKVIVQGSIDTLHVLGVFLLFISVFEAVLTTLRTYLFVDTTNRIDMSLGKDIIDHLFRLPLSYFEKRPVGEISTRVNELENIRSFLTGTALTVVLDAIFSVLYIAVMIFYSVTLTLVALSIIPVFILLTVVAAPIIYRQLRDKAERNAETQSYLVEIMTGIQTVKAQNVETRSRWQWQERYARYVTAGFNTVITSTAASSISGFLNKLSGLLVLWVGAYMVLKGDLTLGQLIAFRIIAGYVTSPILRLAQIWQNFQETALSLERLADIVDTPQEQEAEEARDIISMPSIKGAVKYEKVSFKFKNSISLQLNNVDLDIPAGTFVGIVGPSGAGKSTLTKLLARLYEPEAGRILVDGYDINKVELYSLRRQVGFVPQDTLLFEGTVLENIALTNPDASENEIEEAARVAAAHDFIMTLPKGYATRVGERGASLSGGQKQRIAIARTVLQNPSMLILDEATSALDYITEQQVCDNLNRAFKGRTVFFITHRLTSVKGADLIVMMDGGSVVEVGSHQKLMSKPGRYYSLYTQQASKV